MEKCSFCVQRIRSGERKVEGQEHGDLSDEILSQRNFAPACVQACPTNTLVFGDFNDPESKVSQVVEIDRQTGERKLKNPRAYQLLKELGTEPNVIYLKKIDPAHEGDHGGHG